MTQIVDGYLDRSKHFEWFYGLSRQTGELGWFKFDNNFGDQLVCFDSRKLFAFGLSPLTNIMDLQLIHSWDQSLTSLVRSLSIPGRDELMEAEKRFTAAVRAVSEAKMDVDKIPVAQLVPDEIRIPYMHARLKLMSELWAHTSREQIDHYMTHVRPVFRSILEIERAAIRVDMLFVLSQLKRNDLAQHETKFLRHIQGQEKDGFVRTKISPVGSKTWRLRVDGGFQSMAIPHGVPRQAIVSRFVDGKIVTLDFNAIDYRCLVNAVDDPELNRFYADCRDFHSRTASWLQGDVTPEVRDIAKKITYTHIYGGSTESLQKQTLLPREELTTKIRKLDELFAPITRFRKKLATNALIDGRVVTPAGHVVQIDRNDHEGKIVGLFAQTYSSHIFNLSLRLATKFIAEKNMQSRVIFTVHDELVIDMHPDDSEKIAELRELMEQKTKFVVKEKRGSNYDEATK